MNKIMKAGVGVAAVATVAAGALVISAFGPNRETYTMEHPADKVTFNSITDNPMGPYTSQGNELYFVEASQYTGDANTLSWSDNTVVENGKEYVVHMYVHNDAASNLDLVAENVKAHVLLPSESASSITVTGMISSSNATPSKVWDETTFVSADGRDFSLEYVGGTAKFTNCDESSRNEEDKACTASRKFDLDDALFTENGTNLGYNTMDGKIPGCIAYAGWVSFHVKANFHEEPNYTIEKKAKIVGQGEWADEVTGAKDGDRIAYSLHFTNTGNTTLYDVNLRDLLPDSLNFLTGTTYLVNSDHQDGLQLEDTIATEGGVFIGDYAAGADAYVFFETTIKEGVDDECHNTQIHNVIQASASTTDDGNTRDESKEDTADVYVDGKVCTESFDIDKMVRLANDQKWSETVKAKAGETVYYRIRFFNTGEKDLENVVLSDKMPEHMTNFSEVKYGLVDSDDLTVGEGFFGDGMNIGTVKAGQTMAVYYSAVVDEALAGECEDKTLENVVTGKYGNDDSTIKTETAEVTVDGQICEEDHPGFDIQKKVQIEGSDSWNENVTVKGNQSVRFRIEFTNTGNVDLNNVVISDKLPAQMSFKKGSTVVNGETREGDEIVNGGIKFESVKAGSKITIFYYATADNSLASECGDTKITNTAYGKYDNNDNTTKQDTADVTVTGMVCDAPEYPTTGADSKLGAIIATSILASLTAGYIVSRKK